MGKSKNKEKGTEEQGDVVAQATEEEVQKNTDNPTQDAPSLADQSKTGKGNKTGKDDNGGGQQEQTDETPETVKVQGNEFVIGDTFNASSVFDEQSIKNALPAFLSDPIREKLDRSIDSLANDIHSQLQSYAEAARILEADSLEDFNAALERLRQVQALGL